MSEKCFVSVFEWAIFIGINSLNPGPFISAQQQLCFWKCISGAEKLSCYAFFKMLILNGPLMHVQRSHHYQPVSACKVLQKKREQEGKGQTEMLVRHQTSAAYWLGST